MTSPNPDSGTPYTFSTSIVNRLAAEGWRLETRPPWTHVRAPESIEHIVQGWKLHISATVLSAPDVLDACAPILVDAGCEFKYACDRTAVRGFNDTRVPRGMSGKFITAYPVGEDKLRDLAERLHAATKGLAGPRILSDARLSPDSLVHYRYGAFAGLQRLGNDGSFQYLILDPDGNAILDRRDAYFTPPPWATSPFAPAAPAATVTTAPASPPKVVLLNDRYRVATAIRHANKGGVYLAEDTHTGATVIIKEGRAHVATDDRGRDARDVIRHEGAILAHLEHLGVAPRPVETFTAQDHAFLVEEQLPGMPLVRWVNESLGRGESLPLRRWWRLATDLADLLARVHGAGVILRDFNPNNVLIDDDGGLRLIDLEMAHIDGAGDPIYDQGGTPGCSAPEQFALAAPAYSADLYSLGATLMLLATTGNPEVLTDEPPVRSHGRLLEERLRAPRRHADFPAAAIALIVELMRVDPAQRPTLDQVRATLANVPGDDGYDMWAQPTPDQSIQDTRSLPDSQWDELVDGIVAHLGATIDTGVDSRLWPTTGFGGQTEPCAVQYGAGGVLAVLARLHHLRPTPDVEKVLTAAHDWIAGHVRANPHRLPGMQFGAAGTALALHDAARALDRPDTLALARETILSLPRRWPNPDITHGSAGTGTALLTLWHDTADNDLLEPLAQVADGLLESLDSATMTWTVAPDFDSQLAGYCSYGFAHGTAGIGAFLLGAGQVLDRPDLLDVAQRCGEALAELAVSHDTAAVWHEGPGKPGFLTHWCNGASGVATLLVQLAGSTGDDRYLDLTDRAGRAIMQRRWGSGTAYCHGLAGDGDLLIDLADASGDPLHRAWAEEFGAVLYDRRVYRDGNAVLPNESGLEITAEFGAGLAGHLAFLLRLRHGGTRLFHPPVLAAVRTRS